MRKYILLITVLCIGTGLFGQKPMQQRMDNLRSKRVSFFTEKLELDVETAQNFWPLYNELEKKRMESHRKMRNLFTGYHSEANKEISEEMYAKLADAMIEQRVELSRIEKLYHEKFKKVLTAKQLVSLYRADKEFQKEMLRMYRDGNGTSNRPSRRSF